MNTLKANEKMERISKETGDRKNQMERLEWKNTVTKTKSLLDRLNSEIDRPEENLNLKTE